MKVNDIILYVARPFSKEEASVMILELEEYLKTLGYGLTDQIPISFNVSYLEIPFDKNYFSYEINKLNIYECVKKYKNVLLLGFDKDVYKEYNDAMNSITSVSIDEKGVLIRSLVSSIYSSWTKENIIETFNKEEILEKIDMLLDLFKELKESGDEETLNNAKLSIKVLYESLNEL